MEDGNNVWVLFGNIKKFKNKFGFLKDCSYINDIEKNKNKSYERANNEYTRFRS
jgi:hypothetical protein